LGKRQKRRPNRRVARKGYISHHAKEGNKKKQLPDARKEGEKIKKRERRAKGNIEFERHREARAGEGHRKEREKKNKPKNTCPMDQTKKICAKKNHNNKRPRPLRKVIGHVVIEVARGEGLQKLRSRAQTATVEQGEKDGTGKKKPFPRSPEIGL